MTVNKNFDNEWNLIHDYSMFNNVRYNKKLSLVSLEFYFCVEKVLLSWKMSTFVTWQTLLWLNSGNSKTIFFCHQMYIFSDPSKLCTKIFLKY